MKQEQTVRRTATRKVGKTYRIRTHLPHREGMEVIDLLQTDTFVEYASRPALLRERYNGRFTIIDEVRKAPALLDEVHWLIENSNAQFLLTGSSTRKLRRGHANLLRGLAWRYETEPLSYPEVEGFDLDAMILRGMLAPHFLSPAA